MPVVNVWTVTPCYIMINMSSIPTDSIWPAHLHDCNSHHFSVTHIFLPCRNVIFESETVFNHEIDLWYEEDIPMPIITKPVFANVTMCCRTLFDITQLDLKAITHTVHSRQQAIYAFFEWPSRIRRNIETSTETEERINWATRDVGEEQKEATLLSTGTSRAKSHAQGKINLWSPNTVASLTDTEHH